MRSPNRGNSRVHGRAAAANARRKRRRQTGYWFSTLKAAVQADREQRQVPDLGEDQVLDWADAFFARTGNWPRFNSGPIPEAPGETWLLVEGALAFGLRGFSPGGTLPRFFAAHRGRYNRQDPNFSIEQILAWADAWQARTADWPTGHSGYVPGAGGLSWRGVDAALIKGRGGLPGGSSLAQLLATERAVVHHTPLTEEQILAWADAHHARTGGWPRVSSGPIAEAPEENWPAVSAALDYGCRGLPGGSSLARLLVERRGSRSPGYLPPLAIPQILAWADAFHARTGQWPTRSAGPIAEAPGESWSAIQCALVSGDRGLPGGWSLVRLFAEERGMHHGAHRPPMTIPEILRWADAHHDRHGTWPRFSSGRILEAPGETWSCVQSALATGRRGLPGGSTLALLLRDERGVPYILDIVPFTVERILAWADAHHSRTGKWPTVNSGPIPESPGDTWLKVQYTLRRGGRSLEGGSSLAQLLAEKRGRRNRIGAPDLTIPQILAWADAFQARHGRWPKTESGPIPEAPGETWCGVNGALRTGVRGLDGESSIVRLLTDHRGLRNRLRPPGLTISQILAWADAFQARHGRWPRPESGTIPEAPGETWCGIDRALRIGLRGLPGTLSLRRLRDQERPAKQS